nr:collagen alpha-1(XX) chain-like [Pelodiscus sinensis]|eukprot:XP_025038266.1 collagen alpha-1(XX) chain-like [Pelodiscus sinensis]
MLLLRCWKTLNKMCGMYGKLVIQKAKTDLAFTSWETKKSLDFFHATPSKTLMFRTFSDVGKAFDGSWHKLALSVKGNDAKLLIDCQEVSAVPGNEQRDVSRNEYTWLVKRSVYESPVLVDLQQFEMHCNADKAHSEGCCELLDIGQKGENGEQGKSNSVGKLGIRGDPGLPGREGDPGIEACQGSQGPEGGQGTLGLKVERSKS